MDKSKVIAFLNKALGVEYAAVVQYCQHSALVQGDARKMYEDFFNDASEEARTHAKKVADWIVSLGGVPSVEVAGVEQATEITEMLKQDLALEKNALQAYRDAHAVTDDDAPIRFMLEEQIMLEQNDVWEIEKFLSAHKIKVGKKGVERAS